MDSKYLDYARGKDRDLINKFLYTYARFTRRDEITCFITQLRADGLFERYIGYLPHAWEEIHHYWRPGD